ncbi:efflux RND transporter periplasmic adaptor subunit [Bradyrhizobium sp. HKCCYLS20291]|uniref:efflux RND transporter periplasmic adaptor subunit n=1 Tax=Bradyrhizobium sp. HKCCYLS20291 TaxID=3420766 RepID=UPI003EBF4137
MTRLGVIVGLTAGCALLTSAIAHDVPSTTHRPKQNADKAIPPGVTDALVTPCNASSLLRLEVAVSGKQTRLYPTFGRVVANPSAVINVNAYLSGQISEIFVRPKSIVLKDELIATISSPDFLLTQKAYLALLSNDEQQSILKEEGRLPNFLSDARDNLIWWGMSDEEIDKLTKSGEVVESISVRAPQDGIVTDVFVQPGQIINAGDKTMQNFVVLGKPLVRMVPLSAPDWIEVYLPSDRVGLVKPGETGVRIGSVGGAAATFTISDVLFDVDRSNMMSRAIIRLGQGPKTFALGQTVQLEIDGGGADGIWISRQAVSSQGLDPVVFVEMKPGVFQRRSVKVLETTDDFIRLSNVTAGERAVTTGKMILEGAYRLQSRDAHDHGSCES